MAWIIFHLELQESNCMFIVAQCTNRREYLCGWSTLYTKSLLDNPRSIMSLQKAKKKVTFFFLNFYFLEYLKGVATIILKKKVQHKMLQIRNSARHLRDISFFLASLLERISITHERLLAPAISQAVIIWILLLSLVGSWPVSFSSSRHPRFDLFCLC